MKKGDAMRGWLIGLIGAVALAAPAGAEVRIHLVDRTTPVVTDQIFEEEAWVLYQEGDSGYFFSVPRERVEKLEIVQAGVVRTLQMNPSQEERGSRRRILLKILEAENKEADTIFKRLQDELKNLATTTSAVATTVAAQPGAPGPGAVRAMSPQEAQMALGLQRERLSEVLEDVSVVGLRIERILQQAEKYKVSGPKPKYYFYR